MVEKLSLRLRILLFFVFLGLGAVVITTAALWFAARRLDDVAATSAFINAGLIAGFGILGLTAFVWLLFDENVAKAVERLAAGMRARAHADVTSDFTTPGRYLGDLAPAAMSVTDSLGAARVRAAEEIARKTAALEAEKEQLAAILSRIPLAVAVVSPSHDITLYDGQCAELLGDDHPIRLGASAFEWFDRTTLETAFTELRAAEHPEPRRLALASADGLHSYDATMRRLGKGEGYILSIAVEERTLPARPIVFDFSLFDRKIPDALFEAPLDQLTYVVFDTETTGMDVKRDAVVQIGALRVVQGKLVRGEALDTLVDPGRPIPPVSTKVHHISDEMVQGAPDFAKAGRRFARFASGAVLVAHNAPFDIAFFRREAAVIGTDLDNPVLDTVLLSAAVFGESETHTLDALCDRLNITIPEEERHTALGDARATAEALLRLLPILEGRGITTFGAALEAMRKHQRLLPDLNA